MAKHEFGMMERDPRPGERYDTYEPERYHCISVHDDYLEDILGDFGEIPFYWHTLDRPGYGLAYTGITLIPPGSIPAFLRALTGKEGFGELRGLLSEAERKGKFVIHFGI